MLHVLGAQVLGASNTGEVPTSGHTQLGAEIGPAVAGGVTGFRLEAGGMALPEAVQPLAKVLDSVQRQAPTRRCEDRLVVGNGLIQELYQLFQRTASVQLLM